MPCFTVFIFIRRIVVCELCRGEIPHLCDSMQIIVSLLGMYLPEFSLITTSIAASIAPISGGKKDINRDFEYPVDKIRENPTT